MDRRRNAGRVRMAPILYAIPGPADFENNIGRPSPLPAPGSWTSIPSGEASPMSCANRSRAAFKGNVSL